MFTSARAPDGRIAWLTYVVFSLTSPAPGAIRAARGARAALEGTPSAEWVRPGVRARVRFALRWRRPIPARLAAHLVTIGIVLTVALSARHVVLPGSRVAPSPVSLSRADQPGADVQVQRQLDVVDGGGADGSLPPARAPEVQLAPAFLDSHVLTEGETLGEIAARYQVSIASLFWSNDMETGNVFAAGQELRIPRLSGVPHVIEAGETLDSIAQHFNVAPQAIVLFGANGVREDRPLPVGREIFIPGATLPYPSDFLQTYHDEQGLAAMRAAAAGVVQDSDTNLRAGPGRDYPRLGSLDAGRRLKLVGRYDEWVKVEDGAGTTGWVRGDLLGLSAARISSLAETSDFPPPPPRWVWPTNGDISSSFGWRSMPFRSFHDGLDIANAAGTQIHAASGGRVIEAGWCSGFGYCVKIDHGDGITTIYGHLLKRPPVQVGALVDAGELIGAMGSTYDARGGGYSTGVHLHFTIKLNGKAVNPLKFLP